MGKKLTSQQRKDEIRQMIVNNESVSARELAQRFDVSEMTIHRDLNALEQLGHVKRTHGGASPSERMEFEFDFSARRSANQKAKQAIVAQAATLIALGQRIILDTGTTTLELAFLIKEMKDLTVITPSLAVASVLQFSSGIQTVLLGGIIRPGSPDLTGVVTEKVLDMFMVDVLFQGADGIGLNGELFNADMRMARVDNKMRQRTGKTYILCDSSKIGKTEFASNGSLSQVDGLITDDKISPENLNQLKKINTEIEIVNC